MMATFYFARLSVSFKLLVTGFIVILGAGYLAGALNAALSVGISPAAIADHYGPEQMSEHEAMVMEQTGFVEQEFSFDDLDDTPEPDHDAMMMGAPESTAINGQQMAQLAHVHLLGFAMILLSAGMLCCLTTWSDGLKSVVVATLFLSLGMDIGGLYLVRFVSSNFATLNMVAAVGIGLCLLAISLRVLWELWRAPLNPSVTEVSKS